MVRSIKEKPDIGAIKGIYFAATGGGAPAPSHAASRLRKIALAARRIPVSSGGDGG
jgi:hypothetical protein